MSKNSFTSKITEMRAIFDVERLFVRRFTRVIFLYNIVFQFALCKSSLIVQFNNLYWLHFFNEANCYLLQNLSCNMTGSSWHEWRPVSCYESIVSRNEYPTIELYILNWNINLKEPMLVDVVS